MISDDAPWWISVIDTPGESGGRNVGAAEWAAVGTAHDAMKIPA